MRKNKLLRTIGGKVVYLPFSLGIPWQVDPKRRVKQLITKDIWNKYIKNKVATLIVPGYLIEVLTNIIANNILFHNGVKVTEWIVPEYYEPLLNFFNVKCKYSNKTNSIIDEYNRLIKVIDHYPVPIFFDNDRNMYFNMLNCYGKYNRTLINKNIKKSKEPFWKQLLDNTCCNIENAKFPSFDKEHIRNIKNKYLSKFNLKHRKYILLDNSNLFGITADGRSVPNKVFLQSEIDEISRFIKDKYLSTIVMSNSNIFNLPLNVYKIPSWNRINSLCLFSLLLNAEIVVSSDPNIYLSAALIGCNKVISLDKSVAGWTFDDLPNIDNKNKKLITLDFYDNDVLFDILKGDKNASIMYNNDGDL